MAGIGFELKKLYGKDGGVFRTVGAMGYSVVTTIGPTLLIVLALIASNIIMTRLKIGEYEKMVFSGSVLYCFIGGLLITSIFDTVISRYVSDRIFGDEYEKLLPAVQGSAAMFALILGAIGTAFALALHLIGQLDIYFCLMVFLLFVGVGMTFGMSIFVTAIKAYKRITLAYLIGSVLIVGVSLVCYYLLDMPLGHSMITGFALGFLCICVHLFLYLNLSFPKGDGSYFQYFSAIKENKLLLISGLFYVMGLYVHNIVFWVDSDLQLVAAEILYSAPSYDMASFLAMLTSITSVVIFVVRVETNFYTQYKGYCESVISRDLNAINLNREKMTRTLINEVFFVGEFQLIITIVIMSLSMTLLPLIGISGITLDIYPLLSLGYYAVFMMHILMIFMYYFDDQSGAAFTGVLFFVLTLVFTLITRYLGIAYYGLGLVLSGVICWMVAFIRLRSIMYGIDYKMFCDNLKEKNINAA